MKRKYKRLQRYLEKQGYCKTDVSCYEHGILRMTYKFSNYNPEFINENYKIHILFTSYGNFSIMLEIKHHPMITPIMDEYGNNNIAVEYMNKYHLLYKGILPNYLKAKSIIYYTTKRYTDEYKTLLDDNLEFEVKNDGNDLLMKRMTKEMFEYELNELIFGHEEEQVNQPYEYIINTDSSGYLH